MKCIGVMEYWSGGMLVLNPNTPALQYFNLFWWRCAVKSLSLTTIVLIATILLGGSRDLAAPASASLAKAKQEAEAKGYTFLTSHDEILAKAKAEGKLRATTSLSPPTFKAM